MSKVFVGEVGKRFEVDTEYPIPSGATVSLIVKKPSGTKIEWAGSIESNTYIVYETNIGDLNEAGTWQLQAKIQWNDGVKDNVLYGEITSFEVGEL